MKNNWLAGLALVLLPSVARAGGNGLDVDFKQLIEPLTWRWFLDDGAPQAMGPETRTPRTASPAHDPLHLRYSIRCTSDDPVCADVNLTLGIYTGSWSCTGPAGAPQLPGITSPWQYTDGYGTHGAPVSPLLLPRSTAPGFYVEHVDLEASAALAVDTPQEFDLSLGPVPAHWQPNTRYVFMPQRLASNEAKDLRICDAPAVCTQGGPPVFQEPPQAPAWVLGTPHASSVKLVDWDQDGQVDILCGSLLGSPVWFRNLGGPGLRFAPGVMLHQRGTEAFNLLRTAVVDWDNDGNLDLVYGSHTGQVYLVLNHGDGLADPVPLQRSAALGGGVVGKDDGLTDTVVEAADFDSNGTVDLLVAGTVNPDAKLFLWRSGAPGSVTMATREEVLFNGVTLATALGARNGHAATAFTDWNADGLKDLLIGVDLELFYVALNTGTAAAPSWGALQRVALSEDTLNMGGLVFPDMADLDGDGTPELVLGGFNGTLRVRHNLGTLAAPDFPQDATTTVVAPPVAVTAASRVQWEEMASPSAAPRRHDLLVVLQDGSMEAWLGAGPESAPALSVRVEVDAAVEPGTSPVLADWDGDGRTDLLLGKADGTVALHLGSSAAGWPAFGPATALQAGGGALQVGTAAVPRVVDWNGDGRPDLLVGDGDGKVHLFLGGASGLDADTVLRAGGQPINVGAAASPAMVDWDDDGLPDLLVTAATGGVQLFLNRGTAAAADLQSGVSVPGPGGALPAGSHVQLVDTDYFPLDCAEDLVFLRDNGAARELAVYKGTIPTPAAPTGLAPSGNVDDISGTPVGTTPVLSWDPVTLSAGVRQRYELELAERSDLDPVLFSFTSNHGAEEASPATTADSQQLSRGRRYFWHVRSHDDQGHPGYWSEPAPFAVPLRGHNPVDQELGVGDEQGTWTRGNWDSLKAPDGQLTPLPEPDRLATLTEDEHVEVYALRRTFLFRHVTLPARLLVIGNTAGDSEPVLLEVLTGPDSWREVGRLTSTPGEKRFDLQAQDVAADGTLTLRVRDANPTDATPTRVEWDYLAVVSAALPPEALAGPDRAADEATTVTLDGSGSTAGDGTGLSYLWSQVDGTAVTLTSGNQAQASFTAPPTIGESRLTFRLTVTTTLGASTDDVVITVQDTVNDPPVANAGSPVTGDEGGTLRLDGTGSRDPNGDPLTYAWAQVSGPTGTLDDPSSAQPNFTAPRIVGDASAVLQLTVSDGFLTATDEVTVTLRETLDEPPVANAGADQDVDSGDVVTLDGSGSRDPNGDRLAFRWEQVSGTPPPDLPANLDAETVRFHAPDISGTQAVLSFRLTVLAGGTTTTDEMTVTVHKPLAVDGGVDAGSPDAAQPPDASTADAGTVPSVDAGPDDRDGKTCACTTSSPDPAGSALGVLMVAALGLLRLRRR